MPFSTFDPLKGGQQAPVFQTQAPYQVSTGSTNRPPPETIHPIDWNAGGKNPKKSGDLIPNPDGTHYNGTPGTHLPPSIPTTTVVSKPGPTQSQNTGPRNFLPGHNLDYVTNPTHYDGVNAINSDAKVFDIDHLSSIFKNVMSQKSLQFQMNALPESWRNMDPQALAELVRSARQLMSDIAPYQQMIVGSDAFQTVGNYIDDLVNPSSQFYVGDQVTEYVGGIRTSISDLRKSATTDVNGFADNPNKAGFKFPNIGNIVDSYSVVNDLVSAGEKFVSVLESSEAASQFGNAILAGSEILFAGTVIETSAVAAASAIGAVMAPEAIGMFVAGGLVATALAGVALAGYGIYNSIYDQNMDLSGITPNIKKITDYFSQFNSTPNEVHASN